MKLSEIIEVLKERISEYGDVEISGMHYGHTDDGRPQVVIGFRNEKGWHVTA